VKHFATITNSLYSSETLTVMGANEEAADILETESLSYGHDQKTVLAGASGCKTRTVDD